MNEKNKLLTAAKEAAEYSYSPYSRFKVGAALLCEDGQIIMGTNVENRSYGLTNCAERSAIFTALSRGINTFRAIAVYSPDMEAALPPCGACRQVLSEFVPGDFKIYMSGKKETAEASMEELFPMDSLHDLKK